MGPSVASALAKRLHLNRMTTYRLLKELQDKGLVETVFSKPKKFVATPLEKALDHSVREAKKRAQEMESIQRQLTEEWLKIRELREKFEPIELEEPKFRICQGRQQVYDAIAKICEEAILGGVISLDLSIKEVTSALWKKVLNGEVEVQDAEEMVKDLTKAEAIKIKNQNDYMLGAFKIAVKNRITIYDSIFIELAKNTKTELVTSDSRQAEIARDAGVETKII